MIQGKVNVISKVLILTLENAAGVSCQCRIKKKGQNSILVQSHETRLEVSQRALVAGRDRVCRLSCLHASTQGTKRRKPQGKIPGIPSLRLKSRFVPSTV